MILKNVQTSLSAAIPVSIDLYAAYDPIPVPEAIESDTDNMWALWQSTLLMHNRAVASPSNPKDQAGPQRGGG
jgi:hypothetical protein